MAPATSALANGRLNLSQIRESCLRDLVSILGGMTGDKCIVWDEKVFRSFTLILDSKILQPHSVLHMLMIAENMQMITKAQTVVFILRPEYSQMAIVADCIKQRKILDYHIIFVPRASFVCQQRLEQLGVLGSLKIHQLFIEVFPLDSDYMSMELPDLFKECYVDGDNSQLLSVARAIMMLQSLYGEAPNIRGKGPLAERVHELMTRLRKELSGNQTPQVSQIDTILLFDRAVDLLTPMATQLTYEGLLDEIYGIESNKVSLPASKFPEPKYANLCKNGQINFTLDSSEDLYADLRDRNFTTIGSSLNKLAKNLSKLEFELKDATDKRNFSVLRDCGPRLQKILETKNGLSQHISISELIQEKVSKDSFRQIIGCEQEFFRGEYGPDQAHPKIEDLIATGHPVLNVLRLICMHSITSNGFKPKLLEHYKREVIQQYGLEYLTLLQNLEKCGLIRPYPRSQRGYSVLSKTFRLTVENLNEAEPKDFAHVYQMYAPMSVRIVEDHGKTDWRAIKEILQFLPGPEIREFRSSANKMQRRNSHESLQSTNEHEEKKLVLVVFIGGCTFAEISALRWLSRQEECPLDFVVLTTDTINGDNFIELLS